MSGDDRQNSPSISRQNRPSATFGIFENPQYEKTKGKIAAAVGKIPYLSVEGIKEKNTAIVRLFRLAWCCRE